MRPTIAVAILLSAVLTASLAAEPAVQPAPPASEPRWDDAALAAAASTADLCLAVDATALPDGLLHARLTLAARGPRMVLCYPHWIPGTHAPSGPVHNLGGLRMHDERGREAAWNRDSRDPWRFTVEVPEGARRLVVDLTYIANQPSVNSEGVDVVGGEHHGLVNWNTGLLLPEGAAAARTTCAALLRLPTGWQWASALEAAPEAADAVEAEVDGVVRFAPTTVEEVVDRPVLAGATVDRRRLHAADGAGPEVLLDVVCQDPALRLRDERWISGLMRLPDEAYALFGGARFTRYDVLLLVAGDDMGLEHGSSSVNGCTADMVDFATARTWQRNLIPHEFVHAWVGKHRRPRAMLVDDYQAPPAFDGLWIYEGLTEHLGRVLAVRSKLLTPLEWRREIAADIRELGAMPGRHWRSLRDTCRANWQLRGWSEHHGGLRRGQDFYREGALLWLAIDLRLRQASGGERTLDDFCRGFFGPSGPAERGFDEAQLCAALAALAPGDWPALVRRWIDGTGELDTAWLAGSGWRLVDHPLTAGEVGEDDIHGGALRAASGLELRGGWIDTVAPGSPAAAAGLAAGDFIRSVDDLLLEQEPLALARAVAGRQRFTCHVKRKDGDWEHVTIICPAGLRVPWLERDPAVPDVLAAILTAQAGHGATLPAGTLP